MVAGIDTCPLLCYHMYCNNTAQAIHMIAQVPNPGNRVIITSKRSRKHYGKVGKVTSVKEFPSNIRGVAPDYIVSVLLMSGGNTAIRFKHDSFEIIDESTRREQYVPTEDDIRFIGKRVIMVGTKCRSHLGKEGVVRALHASANHPGVPQLSIELDTGEYTSALSTGTSYQVIGE